MLVSESRTNLYEWQRHEHGCNVYPEIGYDISFFVLLKNAVKHAYLFFFCISLNDKLFLRLIQCRLLAYEHMIVVCNKTGGLFIEHVNCTRSYVGESSIIMYLNGQCSDQQHQFQSSNCNTSISQLSRFHHI